MGSFSIWHWLVVLIYIAAVGWPLWRIVGKTGLHPAFSLALHIPLVNIAALWYLSLVKWPARRD